MLTPTLVLLLASGLLIWSQIKVGQTASISRLFYHTETKKVFKAALWLIGSILIFHDLGNTLLTLGGLSLIGVPIFGDFLDKTTRWFHFGLAGAFFIFTSLYLGVAWLIATLLGTAIGFLVIKRNAVYWLEVAGIILLITGFYVQG